MKIGVTGVFVKNYLGYRINLNQIRHRLYFSFFFLGFLKIEIDIPFFARFKVNKIRENEQMFLYETLNKTYFYHYCKVFTA